MGVLYTALIGFGCISHSLQKGYLYTYTYVGLSALLVSDDSSTFFSKEKTLLYNLCAQSNQKPIQTNSYSPKSIY